MMGRAGEGVLVEASGLSFLPVFIQETCMCKTTRLWAGTALCALVLAAGCGGESPSDPDGGEPDAGPMIPDSGPSDDDGGVLPPDCTTDMCGTCDDDPSNDCVQDCAGAWGGTAAIDMCGTCDDDPSNDCVQDCAGDWGGDAMPDMCGTCDADPSNDCAQDCAGDWGGDAVVDDCGTCDADPANDCDCAGTPGGSATTDMCGTCDADPSNDCVLDCAGVWGGSSTLDGCGVCDDDPTNDCPNDCAGVPGGPARLDMCGTCDADPANDCEMDCAGDWGGAATTDMCGTCDADPTNDCVQDCAGAWGGAATTDMCGTCDADPTNDCEMDCAGDWGGAAALDLCGRCTGGSTGATPCPTVTLTPIDDATVDELNPSTNYGSDPTLEVTAESRPGDHFTFLKFDLSSLPAGAVVRGVRLSAQAFEGYAWGGNGSVYTRHVTDDSWDESTLTWDNMPAAEPTNLGSWWLWYDRTPRDQLGVNDSDLLVPVVQQELDGDGRVSFRLHSPGYDTSYRSSEHPTASERPQLVVGYLPSSTTTLEPVADTYARNGIATTYGSDTSLQIRSGSSSRVFLRFDLSSLPAGAEVVSARLTMTAYSGYAWGGDGHVYTHLVTDDSWTEAALNGLNAPSAEAAELGRWWLWYDSTPMTRVGSFSTPELRDAVQTEATGDGAISLRLHSSGYDTNYRSREHGTRDERPALELRYVVP